MNRLAPLFRHAARFWKDASGVALIEFAYSLPFLMILGLGGFELANYTVTHMRVSQIALSLADNSSRFKEEYVGNAPVIREYDVDQAFKAVESQASGLDFEGNGRVILSSLETNSSGGQWIHWQRCFGDAPYSSSYGVEGEGKTGTSFAGMGPSSKRLRAETGYAIMFAEVYYDYKPLAFDLFIPDIPIHKVAAMYVRDDRDLTEIRASTGITPAKCS